MGAEFAGIRFQPLADSARTLLANAMRRAVLFGLAAVASCASEPESTCPSVEALAGRNAVADARAALARGDRHLLMLGGFVGEIPGVRNSGRNPTRKIEGTSDTATAACRRLGGIAEAYATKYNQTVVHGG